MIASRFKERRSLVRRLWSIQRPPFGPFGLAPATAGRQGQDFHSGQIRSRPTFALFELCHSDFGFRHFPNPMNKNP
jgi:hypothetical protein